MFFISNPYLLEIVLYNMSKVKSIAKAIVLIISGIAIVVVGGFMMGAIARLWTDKKPKNPKESENKK